MNDDSDDYGDKLGAKNPRDTVIQIALSLLLGVSAFVAFCILRPRWKGLYQARKLKRPQASPLPELPDTMLGWVPALWKITEQQVLASAGLDAYVFLRFFKMALKFLSFTLFFALVVFKPVHDSFPDMSTNTTNPKDMELLGTVNRPVWLMDGVGEWKDHSKTDRVSTDYLWMYLVFAYVFSGLAIYLLVTETKHIISVRQEYLGNQSTITDRTIRLSGIPMELRSEDKIKEFIEELEIGKVDSVMLCRDWTELDTLVLKRKKILRKLEEACTVYLSRKDAKPFIGSIPTTQSYTDATTEPNEDESEVDESGPLLAQAENGHAHSAIQEPNRPRAMIRFGFLGLRSHYVDAIDYYDEELRSTDEKINELRKSTFEAAPIAFVTMDSTAACQMASQAVLDPSPMHLIASPAPAPNDVVWINTYTPRSRRMIRGWIVTVIITILTVFWSAILVPIAGAINPDTIKKVWPQLGDALKENPTLSSLVTTQLPTLLITLLFVAVPYLYDWLANCQSIISQSDVELSVISKNFFFSFFNYFIIFTIFGTLSNFSKVLQQIGKQLTDTTAIANSLAQSLQKLLTFYSNLIILQGVGLFPFRLLEFGSVALYPFYRMFSKTPRDFAELDEPPIFNYGFYLPQVMLIFIICIVYSVLRDSWQILLAGLIYFAIGGFVYKYQLLYAMDQRHHSTGRAWTMICRRMMVGVILFQLTTAGQLALKHAYNRAAAMAPLIVGTIWFIYVYTRNYDPLMKFIALRSIERKLPSPNTEERDPDGWGETARLRYEAESHPGHTVDETDESGIRFMNPSLVLPLEDVWLKERPDGTSAESSSSRRRLTTVLNSLY